MMSSSVTLDNRKLMIRIGEEWGIRIGEEWGIRIDEEWGIRIDEEWGIRNAFVHVLYCIPSLNII